MSQAAVTSELANGLFHVLSKDYFMLHKILCGFITAHSPFNFCQLFHSCIAINFCFKLIKHFLELYLIYALARSYCIFTYVVFKHIRSWLSTY